MINTPRPNERLPKSKSSLNPIVIIGLLFFIFGFITWLNGTLIPFLKIACELSNFQAYLVTFAFYISYLIMSLPSSMLLKKIGFKKGIAWGLFIMGIGSALFIPAAFARSYMLFLVGLFIMGSGLALLQTASNPYVTLLGPEESAARRISIMGICNKMAGVISPIILGAIVLQGMEKMNAAIAASAGTEKAQLLDSMAQRVVLPYIIITVALFFLAMIMNFVHLPEVEAEEEVQEKDGAKVTIFHFPHLLLGVLALFLYVGAEVLAGDSIVLYGLSQGISLDVARTFTSYTLGSMVLGYLLGIFLIPKYISQSRALVVAATIGFILSIGAVSFSGLASVLCLALLGFANAIMWPAIFPLAISGLGRFTKTGSALLVMSIGGGAVIPLLYGKLTDCLQNAQAPYLLLLPIYLYIGYFALHGHKVGRKSNSK
jgi:MFS transporter, FHS family, L-fucose permease